MENPKTPTPEELILAMLRQVLANQAQAMGLNAPPSTQPPATQPAAPTVPTVSEPTAATPPPAAPSPAAPAESRPPAASAPVFAPIREERVTAAPSQVPQSARVRKGGREEEEETLSRAELEELAEYRQIAEQPLAPSNMARTLKWIAAIVLGLIVLINLPLFGGLALARALPDQQALIVRDGLVLKGSGERIYVLENNQKRWISSLQLFERQFRWDDVHVVDDAFLAQFPDGRPLYLVLKCEGPHIYRIEDGKKRWIKDIPTFLSEGHVWEDVQYMPCGQLRQIPDGIPIPPDAGIPPTP